MPDWSCQNAKLLHGDVLERLAEIDSDSVHCCVTSPPYYRLRSYLPEDHPDKPKELGSEPTPEEYIERQVAVFREVRRVLHPTGLLFLDIGDSRNATTKSPRGVLAPKQATNPHAPDDRPYDSAYRKGEPLCIPWRLLDALRADGWRFVQEIVWHKAAPMPEPVQGWRWERCRVKTSESQWAECPGCPKCQETGGWILRKGRGRCTAAHEYIFVLAKSDRYFWNSAEFRLPASGRAPGNKRHKHTDGYGTSTQDHRVTGLTNIQATATHNPRSVWTISSEPSSEHHFAAFPSELARRCILAGTSSGGCCPQCGMPWVPMVETAFRKLQQTNNKTQRDGIVTNYDHSRWPRGIQDVRIVGYRPACDCNAAVPRETTGTSVPCLVLDPYAGTGTVLQVARHMGRRSIGIELNEDYIEIAKNKIPKTPRCFLRQTKTKQPPETTEQRKLFQ